MASHLKACFFFSFVVVHALFLLCLPVLCDDEDNLVQGLNSYRTSLNLPALSRNDNAECVAEELADDMEDQPCANPSPGNEPKLGNYPNIVSKCKVNSNSTVDGVVLPVCVRKLVPTLVLTNYTRSHYARYLNDSRFTGVGVGSEDDWMVVVLSTNTPTGSFANGGGFAVVKEGAGFGHCVVVLLLGLFLFLV